MIENLDMMRDNNTFVDASKKSGESISITFKIIDEVDNANTMSSIDSN
jgi:hypothetical protein